MDDLEELTPEQAAKPFGKARRALLRRLVDVVAMPTSAIAPSDRAMAGDVLLDMLFHVDDGDRLYVSHRLRAVAEAPRRLLRYLAQCAYDIAEPILADNEGLDASDLRSLVDEVSPAHQILIARRKGLEPDVAEALAEAGEPEVIRTLLRNRHVVLPELCLDRLVSTSRNLLDLCPLLMGRRELTPSQAMAMFWWSDGPTRRAILQRHAADRELLIRNCADVFPLAAAEKWADPVARKTLQLIEQRQRNRLAIAKSPFESLEHAVETAARKGMDATTAQEIGYLSGVKPVTIAKIMSDRGGEALAVLCKATGLKRDYLDLLWRAQRRPLEMSPGEPHPQFVYVKETFEMLSVGRAQTTLRYWNWALSSSYSPSGLAQTEHANDENEFSAAKRTAQLVFGS